MSSLRKLIEATKKQRLEDKKRWESLDSDTCQVCGTKGDDRRTLFISCLYNLKEVSPLFIDLYDTQQREKGFGLRICKGCRVTLLGLLYAWIEMKGRLVDPHLDDDGLFGYSEEEFKALKKT